jgi:hypothetical protein
VWGVGTEKPILAEARIFSTKGQSESTVLLKPSFMPEIVTLFILSNGAVKAQGPDCAGQILPSGHYDVAVQVVASEQTVTTRKRLVVGTQSDNTYWTATNS